MGGSEALRRNKIMAFQDAEGRPFSAVVFLPFSTIFGERGYHIGHYTEAAMGGRCVFWERVVTEGQQEAAA